MSLLASPRLLNEATGSLLDDVQLVNTLQTSKVTATEVTEQLETSETTEINIDMAREVSSSTLQLPLASHREATLMMSTKGPFSFPEPLLHALPFCGPDSVLPDAGLPPVCSAGVSAVLCAQ